MGLDFLRPLRAACVVSTIAVAFSACQQPTQITLEITTDIDCGSAPETAIIVGTGDAESLTPGTVTESCNGDRIGAIVLLPKDSTDERVSIRVVTGVGAKYSAEDCLRLAAAADDKALGNPTAREGCIIARRTLNFIPRTPLFLPVKMRGACLGKRCEPSSTCAWNGDCIAAEVPDPESCSEADGCVLPGDEPIGGAGGSGGQGGAGSSSSGMGGMGGMNGSSSSSSGKAGAGGASSSSGSAGAGGSGGMSSSSSSSGMSSSTGTGGNGGSSGSSGMSSSSGTGGNGGSGGSGGMSSSTGTGGNGGSGGSGGMSSSTGTGGNGGSGGSGGAMQQDAGPADDAGMVDSGGMSSSSGFPLPDAGPPVDSGVVGDPSELFSRWNTAGDDTGRGEMLIAPGYLVPGQHYAAPRRRNRVRSAPLRLPLYTHPRNVKP